MTDRQPESPVTILHQKGWMVVCPTADRSPENDWDGRLHVDRDVAVAEVHAARKEGYEAHLGFWEVDHAL